jgi:hypothetical protein
MTKRQVSLAIVPARRQCASSARALGRCMAAIGKVLGVTRPLTRLNDILAIFFGRLFRKTRACGRLVHRKWGDFAPHRKFSKKPRTGPLTAGVISLKSTGSTGQIVVTRLGQLAWPCRVTILIGSTRRGPCLRELIRENRFLLFDNLVSDLLFEKNSHCELCVFWRATKRCESQRKIVQQLLRRKTGNKFQTFSKG